MSGQGAAKTELLQVDRARTGAPLRPGGCARMVRRMTIEAGVGTGWHQLIRDGDLVYSLERFGESAPGAEVAAHLGFSVEAVTKAAKQLLTT